MGSFVNSISCAYLSADAFKELVNVILRDAELIILKRLGSTDAKLLSCNAFE
jgi:hypothetical protein